MFDPKEIRHLLRRQPFLPLRIHLIDGTEYLILHPDTVVIEHNLLHILRVEESPDSPTVEYLVYVAIMYITHIDQRITPLNSSGF